ncbi:hypothetical protein V1506DRAFT_480542 [Lipomyces tetrasporus]
MCALHFCLKIALCLKEAVHNASCSTNKQEIAATIQQADDGLSRQLDQHQFGQSVFKWTTCFGKMQTVVIDVCRCEDADSLPHALLDPSQPL